jgi:hypothetical protein
MVRVVGLCFVFLCLVTSTQYSSVHISITTVCAFVYPISSFPFPNLQVKPIIYFAALTVSSDTVPSFVYFSCSRVNGYDEAMALLPNQDYPLTLVFRRGLLHSLSKTSKVLVLYFTLIEFH